jgi:hypothetical protein
MRRRAEGSAVVLATQGKVAALLAEDFFEFGSSDRI